MALLRPAWVQPVSGDSEIPYSAADDRAAVLAAMFSREGVLDRRGGDLKVTQRAAGANMTVDVAPGRAAIQGDDVSDQGTYVVTNTTPYSLPIPAPPASGTRTHRVLAQVRDKGANASWSVYDWVITLLPDTGAGLRDEPASAITLGTVQVPAGAGSVTNAMISDNLRPRATVGTRADSGDVAPYPGWVGLPSNMPRYSVTPDGLVILSGVITRTAATFTAAATTYYEFATLPAEIRPKAGRNVPMLAQGFRQGIAQLNPNGVVNFAFVTAQTITQNVFWASLDGLAYRIGE